MGRHSARSTAGRMRSSDPLAKGSSPSRMRAGMARKKGREAPKTSHCMCIKAAKTKSSRVESNRPEPTAHTHETQPMGV